MSSSKYIKLVATLKSLVISLRVMSSSKYIKHAIKYSK